MTYTLFYNELSASKGIRVLLEEMGQPYELVETGIDWGTPRAAELLALNPNGWIPVLIDEDQAIYEAGAITTYLCDKHSEAGLAPDANAPERGLFLQWLFYFSSSIQTAFQMTYYTSRFCDTPEHEESVKRQSITRLRQTWQVVDDAIGDNAWVLGDRFSAVDIYMFMLTTWLRSVHGHPKVCEFANVARIADAVRPRDSVQLVFKAQLEAEG